MKTVFINLATTIGLYLMIFFSSGLSAFCEDSTYIEYYVLTNEAEWYYEKGDLIESEKYLDTAFLLVDRVNIKDLWIYCSILNQTNREKESAAFLRGFLKEQGLSFKDDHFNKVLVSYNFSLSPKELKKMTRKLSTNKEVWGEVTCRTCEMIDSMHALDQKYRKALNNNLDSVYYHSNEDSAWVDIRTALIKVDSANSSIIKELVVRRKLENAAHLCASNLYHLLLHMNDQVFFDIRQDLFLYIKSGQLNPWEFACVYDRHLILGDSCLKFFAYPLTDNLDCVSYDEILENRRSIGLSTHYSRQSWGYYIKKGTMMKFDFRVYYDKTISSK